MKPDAPAKAVAVLRWFAAGVVVLVGLATLLGLLDRFCWGFETADVFRLSTSCCSIGCAIVALLLRRPRPRGVRGGAGGRQLRRARHSACCSVSAARASGAARLRLVVANVEVGNSDFAAVRRLVVQTLQISSVSPS